MPLLRCCFFISVLLLLYNGKAVAQSTTNRVPNKVTYGIDPLNARQVDSLARLNDLRLQTAPPLFQQYRDLNFKRTLPTSLQLSRTQGIPSQKPSNQKSNSVCYTISGREFLYQDSVMMWTMQPTITADGNVLVSGEFADYSKTPTTGGGFCMKTDFEGNIIWARLYDSTEHKDWNFLNLFQSLELRNGTILLAGRTENKTSGNEDLVLMKVDATGNPIWTKTYASKFWQGFHGSGDYFKMVEMEEDPATGEVYFVGNHSGGIAVITRIDVSDGHIIWSNGYDGWDSDHPFGIVINADKILLFQLENGYYNDSYIDVFGIRKTDGDTLFTKSIVQTGDRYSPRLYNTWEVVKQMNGHYLLSGPTTGYWEYPAFSGTKDLYHAGIIELDDNFNFVKAYGFKNRVESNSYNTRISLNPDGTGVFTMFKFISGYKGEAHISLFRNDLIYHQRKRIHTNEGIPNEPPTLRMPDGGFVNIKLMGDSTKTGLDGARIDYYRMHTSDTASLCLGLKDSATSVWYFNFEPFNYARISKIYKDVFTPSLPRLFISHDFTTHVEPACQVISHCDTLALELSASIVCPGTPVTLTAHKNKACGSLVPIEYDTTWISSITKVSDSSYTLLFNKAGKGFIRGSLLGCQLHKDSVLIEVMPARNSLDLGPDTVICPGNSLVLHGGKGFASYTWQDGSMDSVYTVTSPGTYYLTATNSCSGVYSDTVRVQPHPPIPFDLGPDRSKCNIDTLHLNAPPGFLNYSWSNNYNISSTTSQNVIVNPSMDTAYFIKAEKTTGCFAYDTVRIHVNTSPPINLGADISFCSGDSAIFNAGSGFNQYTWSNGNTTQQIIVKTTGVFSVMGVTAQGCKTYDTVRVVNVFSNPAVSLDHTSFLCTGTSRLLDAGSFSSYLWNDGSTAQKMIAKDVGTYAVQVTDNNGCRGIDTTRITTILPLPLGFLPGDTLLCSYDKLTVRSLKSFSSYQWSSGASASSITVSQPGTYWLQVKDVNGCVGRDSIIISPKDCMKGCYVPTAFSPNKDGKNDIFRPLLFGNVKKYQFTIYNRWGQIVFQTTELNKSWDGTVAGILQEPNVFLWTCTYQFEGEEVKTERGTVMLVR